MLKDTFYVLPAIRCECRVNNKAPPYLYDQYNITAHYMQNLSVGNVLGRTINCLIEGLNKHRLPRFIIVLLDGDLVAEISNIDRPGISNLIGKAIRWVTRMMEQLLEIKKEDLFNRCTGALAPNEPKIVWIKMIECPSSTRD